jgi:hypothetical protein
MAYTSRTEELLEQILLEQKESRQDLSAVRETLAVNTESLRYHIKRTDLLEEHVHGLSQKALTYVGILGGITAIAKHLGII